MNEKLEGAPSPDELIYEDENGRLRCRLGLALDPEIKPISPRVLRRLISTWQEREPQPPMVVVPIEGSTVGQQFADPDDEAFKAAHWSWSVAFSTAILQRCIWDGLVVPEDSAWAEKLVRSGVGVPEGIERQEAYVEEVLPQLFTDPDVQLRFIEAIRAISLPTEEAIEEYRRKFRSQV